MKPVGYDTVAMTTSKAEPLSGPAGASDSHVLERRVGGLDPGRRGGGVFLGNWHLKGFDAIDAGIFFFAVLQVLIKFLWTLL